jgi:hypothetical protein
VSVWFGEIKAEILDKMESSGSPNVRKGLQKLDTFGVDFRSEDIESTSVD